MLVSIGLGRVLTHFLHISSAIDCFKYGRYSGLPKFCQGPLSVIIKFNVVAIHNVVAIYYLEKKRRLSKYLKAYLQHIIATAESYTLSFEEEPIRIVVKIISLRAP